MTHLIIGILLGTCLVLAFISFLLLKAIKEIGEDLDQSYKHISDIYSGLDTVLKGQEDLWFYINSNYYDFLDHLHQTYHITIDENNRPIPTKPGWSLEDEVKFLKFREWIKEEAEKRNLPFPARNRD